MTKLHTMHLNSVPFNQIKSGKKTIELRLFDDKRKKITVGDLIVFINTENKNDFLYVIVKELFVFRSFSELYSCLSLSKLGYDKDTISTASPSDMESYYSYVDQLEYGVLAIEFCLQAVGAVTDQVPGDRHAPPGAVTD